MLARSLALTGAVLLAVGAWTLHAGLWALPERFDPWAPLDVLAPPNVLTGFKLRRTRQVREPCLAALDRAGLDFEPVADRQTAPGCGFTQAVRLRRGASLGLGTPVVLSCGAALAFGMWERHALQPAARERLGASVVAVEHLGSYACRDVNTGEGARAGGAPGRRSRHATADALDISGFVLDDRRRVTLRRDWGGVDASADFLRASHAGACRFFDGVLGPDYNAVHADHLHLEIGGWRSCR